jgi:hypothetical protein
MKLKELAEIKKGLDIPSSSLFKVKPHSGNHFLYLKSNHFKANVENIATYISEKEIKKLKFSTYSASLNYGDFLLVQIDYRWKIIRWEKTETTIPSNEICIIRSNLSIVSEFLGYEKNKTFFLTELEKKISKNPQSNWLELVGDIEILTENILEIESNNESDDLELRKPIDKSFLPIKMVQKPLTLDNLLKRIEYGELLLDTEFQRRPNLWKEPVKSRFIEALIVRIPIPAFYFDGSDDNKWNVIDGLQRLSTVVSFIKGEFSLTELDYLVELSGKKFSDLERVYQRNIEEYEIFAYIFQSGTPHSVKYKIFKNINTSALILESQEIRHSINPGKPADFLKKVVERDWFKKYIPISEPLKTRMYDREVVLRYITFQEKNYLDYSPSLVELLDEMMYHLYELPEFRLREYESDLEKVTELLFKLFDESPFSREILKPSSTSYTHNNIMFELLTFSFSKLSPQDKSKVLPKKEFVKKNIKDFFYLQYHTYPRFWDYDYAYSQEGLQKRFKDMEQFMASLIKSI